MDATRTQVKNEIELSIVEDALEKAHHVLAGIPMRYELDEADEKNKADRTRRAQWLFTQKEALNIDISIALDYIEKSIDEVFACQEGGGQGE